MVRTYERARDGALVVGLVDGRRTEGQDSMDSVFFHQRDDGAIVVGKLGVLWLAGVLLGSNVKAIAICTPTSVLLRECCSCAMHFASGQALHRTSFTLSDSIPHILHMSNATPASKSTIYGVISAHVMTKSPSFIS